MKNILITAIGGDIAQGVATIIREMGRDYRLVGVDMREQHGGYLFVDAFHCVPPAFDKDYIQTIKKVVDKEAVDVVVPMAEPELALLDQLQQGIKQVQWITAGREVIAAGLDKLITVRALANFGLPVPWTTPVTEGSPKRFPCILKNRTGSGSRSVFTVSDSEDAEYLSKRYPDAIYQELLEPADKEVTCAVYRTSDGRVATLQMLRRLVGGLTGWARIIDDAEIATMCEIIANRLNLRGSMNVQLRLTPAGPRIFEINPRFSSTALMRHRSGFSDVAWSLEELEGGVIEFPSIAPGRVIVRTQGATVIDKLEEGLG